MSSQDILNIERRDALKLLYSNAGTGVLMSFLAATLLVYTLPGSASTLSDKRSWWIAMTIVQLLRLSDMSYFYWRLRYSDAAYNPIAYFRISVGTLLTAALWSVYAVYIIQNTNIVEVAVTSIIISAFAGGSVSLLSGSRKLSLLYSLVLTMPFAITLLLAEHGIYHTLGILAFVFSIAVMFSSNKAAHFTRRAIHLKYQNNHLLAHMEQEVDKRTREIHSLSNIDPLTGLYNRKAFAEKLSYRLETQPSSNLAILFIDLDGFKAINDSLGHETGDLIIQEAGKRIQHNIQDRDLLCRWGGDEFLLAVEQNEQTSSRAQHLIDLISVPYLIEGSKLNIGATIGIAYYPLHGTDHERLIQRADMAMYNQKRHKKGKVGVFDESLREQLLREIRLKDHLENAIHRHELFLVYQPIVATNTGKVAAVEALLRWRLDGELIPADEFIAVAEQYGFIRAIGLWTLGEACLAGKRMQEHNPDLAVSVNVSIQQLLDDEFPAEVAATLQRTGFRADRLDLEITESLFAHDKHRLINNISRLKETGIKVSIDDFGTGYSSLSVMQEFDVDFVKIDRTFVWSMDTGGRAIVEAVSQIASAFDYKVVAEGVETEEQRRLLTNLGIDYLQGYLFLPPSDEEEVVRHLH